MLTFIADDELHSQGSAERHEPAVLLPDSSGRRRHSLLSGVNFGAGKDHLRRRQWRLPSVAQTDDNWRRSNALHQTIIRRLNNYVRPAESTPLFVVFGVPRGSVLRPIVFRLWTADFGAAVLDADDTQIYGSCRLCATDHLHSRVTDCIVAVWMRCNRHQLNTANTEFLWCQHQPPTDPLAVGADLGAQTWVSDASDNPRIFSPRKPGVMHSLKPGFELWRLSFWAFGA